MDADDYFQKIYQLSLDNDVGDYDLDEALKLASDAVKKFPDNYRLLMLYGILLGDNNDIKGAEYQFMRALKASSNPEKEIYSGWPEEMVFHHMAICKEKNNEIEQALLLYFISYLVNDSNISAQAIESITTRIENADLIKAVINKLRESKKGAE
ncbi:MAG: hypothetical protein AAGA64_18265 [Bacteroidota bacterium]